MNCWIVGEVPFSRVRVARREGAKNTMYSPLGEKLFKETPVTGRARSVSKHQKMGGGKRGKWCAIGMDQRLLEHVFFRSGCVINRPRPNAFCNFIGRVPGQIKSVFHSPLGVW